MLKFHHEAHEEHEDLATKNSFMHFMSFMVETTPRAQGSPNTLLLHAVADGTVKQSLSQDPWRNL